MMMSTRALLMMVVMMATVAMLMMMVMMLSVQKNPAETNSANKNKVQKLMETQKPAETLLPTS